MTTAAGDFDLSPEAASLAAEKPFAWEYRLFSEVVYDWIAQTVNCQEDEQTGSAIGRGMAVPSRQAIVPWMQCKLDELQGLATCSTDLLNHDLQVAFGEPGQPGDAAHIISVGRGLAESYHSLRRWSAEVEAVSVPARHRRLPGLLASASQNMIREMEEFATAAHVELAAAVRRHEQTGRRETLSIALSLTCPDLRRLRRAIFWLNFG